MPGGHVLLKTGLLAQLFVFKDKGWPESKQSDGVLLGGSGEQIKDNRPAFVFEIYMNSRKKCCNSAGGVEVRRGRDTSCGVARRRSG
jgi:hypothetical protein